MDSIGIIETFFIYYFHIRNRKKITYKLLFFPALWCYFWPPIFLEKKHIIDKLADVALNNKPRY
jgi:hypothetical protein